MSSEMRELVRKAEALAVCVMAVDSYSRDELRVFAENFRDEARALLARTEAGADGADTFAEWLATEMPAGTVIGNPAWWANRIARQYRVRSGVTHPQDASGDAEMLDWLDRQAADGVHVEVCCTGNFDARTIARKATVYVGRPQSEHKADSVREAIRNAMQAKEAK